MVTVTPQGSGNDVAVPTDNRQANETTTVEPITVELITTESAFDALEVAWKKLTGPDSRYGIFNSWACNRTWWRHHSHLGKLAIYVAKERDSIVGIAPLYQRTTQRLGFIKLETLQFIGRGASTTPDDLDFLIASDHPGQDNIGPDNGVSDQVVSDRALHICQHLLQSILAKTNLQRLYLQDLPTDSVTLQCLLKTKHPYSHTTTIASRRVARLADNWPSFLSQKSRNFRKQVKRRNNRLARIGTFTYRRCLTEPDIEEAFAALKQLHQQRWLTKQGVQSESFSETAYLNFHRELMTRLAADKQLWLLTLNLDDTIIGVEYGFSYNGRLSLFQTGFSPAHSQLAPGHLMMTQLIRLAIDDGITEVDLLKGDYEYKESYADGYRYNRDIDIVLSPVAGAILNIKRWTSRLSHWPVSRQTVTATTDTKRFPNGHHELKAESAV